MVAVCTLHCVVISSNIFLSEMQMDEIQSYGNNYCIKNHNVNVLQFPFLWS